MAAEPEIQRSRLASRLRALTVVGLLVVLCLPATGAPLATGGALWNASMSDAAFQPFAKRDGYVQAWNVSFRGSGHAIVATFLVSNIGPGDLNNGVSLFIGSSRGSSADTAEFARADLVSGGAPLSLTMGGVNSITYEGRRVKIRAKVNGRELKLTLVPRGSGVRFSGGRFPVRGSAGAFLQVDVPVLAASATGTLNLDGKEIALRGVAGMEHILSNESPHVYAKMFELTRTFSSRTGLTVGGLHGGNGQPDEFRAALSRGGRVAFMRIVAKREVINPTQNKLSGYSIPTTTIYHLRGPGVCRVTVQRVGIIGGFDVMKKVSALLRWVLRTFFANPYILHYHTRAHLTCEQPALAGIPAEGIRTAAQTSYYPVNH